MKNTVKIRITKMEYNGMHGEFYVKSVSFKHTKIQFC